MKLNKWKLQEWLRKWDFALMFFGALMFFAFLASLEEILKNIGLA